jgi:CubicO group peptidase (beta-lactamase class C family)
MTNRRDLLRALVAGAILASPSRALARQQPRRKAKGKTKRAIAVDDQPAPSDGPLNDVLAGIRDEHHLPGLVGAISIGSRLAASGAVGLRKIGSPEPLRFTDQMHLGSNTKAMTATMLGTLVEAGKLSWKSTIRSVFPDNSSLLHPQFQAVTLAQLLTHRAGLPHDGPWWNLPGTTATEQRLALLVSMLERAPASRPGSTYVYSNVGYALAGLMAEQVTGESWESLMRKRLFEPLGMTSAGFGSPGQSGSVTEPWGHHRDGNEVTPSQLDNPPSMGPAGTVHCSVSDWAKFAALHIAGEHGASKLLKPATLKCLHVPPQGCYYAGGWTVGEQSWARGLTLSHNGSNTCWYATIWLAPVRNVAVLVVTNQGDKQATSAVEQACNALIRYADRL